MSYNFDFGDPDLLDQKGIKGPPQRKEGSGAREHNAGGDWSQ